MNLSELSERLTENLTARLNYDEEKKEIIAYGIESLALTIFGFLAIMFAGFLINALFPTIIAAISGGLLRRFSGGAHFKTPTKCLIFGAVAYSLLGFLTSKVVQYGYYNTIVIMLIMFFSLIMVVILAPVDSEEKPIHSVSFRRKLKIASVSFILLIMAVILISKNYLINTGAAMGIFYQSMTLLPVFNIKKKEG